MRATLGHRIRKHATVVVCCAAVGMAMMTQGGCDSILGGRRECEGGPECTGPTTIRECLEGEGNTRWTERTCPPEQRCIPAAVHRCGGDFEGATCTTDRGCLPELRCEASTCRGPLLEEKARCELGAHARLPDDGSEVAADVQLVAHSAVAKTASRPSCFSALDSVVAEGFLHLDVTETRTTPLEVEVTFDDTRERFPQGVQVGNVACESLYTTFGRTLPCQMAPSGSTTKASLLGSATGYTVLFYTTAAADPAPVLHARFKRGSR